MQNAHLLPHLQVSLDEVAELLRIEAIELDLLPVEQMPPENVLICFSNNKIHICEICIENIDSNGLFVLIFMLIKELRRYWQSINEPELLASYLPEELCVDEEFFHTQASEVDSNAFAALVMKRWYHAMPSFEEMPGTAFAMISERMIQINSTLNWGGQD